MKLLIDARKLGHGGIGTYLHNLISGLCELAYKDLTIITRPGYALLQTWQKHINVICDKAEPYSLDELFFMPRRLNLKRYDLIHVPHFTLPFGISIPSVVTIHDLIHVNSPEKVFYPYLAKPLIRSTLKRASQVVAVSDATFAEIANLVRHNDKILSKVSVIPNALDPELLAGSNTGAIAKKLGINEPYFLSVWSLAKPHKGARELLQGFSLLKKKSSNLSPVKLVVAGQGAEIAKQRLNGVAHLAQESEVFFVGNLEKRELADLYAGAQALVVSSRTEGFCLPVLEAQATKTAVLSTPVPAVRNLLTSRDLMFDDFTAESIASGMEFFINNKSTFDAVAPDYEQHLERFNRVSLTEQILNVYAKALE